MHGPPTAWSTAVQIVTTPSENQKALQKVPARTCCLVETTHVRHEDQWPPLSHALSAVGATCQRELVRLATPDLAASAGNLFRTADGRLAYIDFGMMGEIDPNVRR